MKLRPLSDRVIIQYFKPKDKTEGGIIIPETSHGKPQEGIIIAIGEGRYEYGASVPMKVKVGEKVLFARYAAIEVGLEQKDYLILREVDIMAVIEDE